MADLLLLSPAALADLRRLKQKLDGANGPDVINGPRTLSFGRREPRFEDAGGNRRSSLTVRIAAVDNDYIVANPLKPDGTISTAVIYAAKPDKLQHGLTRNDGTTRYLNITAFTTVDSNTATVTADGTDYTWKVTPDAFTSGDIVRVNRGNYTGVTVNDQLLAWEVDPGQRHWAAEDAE